MFLDVVICGIVSKDQVQKEIDAFSQSHKVQITETCSNEALDLGYEILMEVIE